MHQCLGVTATGAGTASRNCWAAAWEFSGLDHSHAATPQLCVSSALHVLSSPMFRAWRSLPLTCLKLLVDLCVRDELAASVRVCCTSAAFVELLFRGWRAVAFPRWLHVLSCSCSTCLIFMVMVRCYFGGLCFDFIDAIVASGELCARVSEALLALPSQALLLPRHLEMTNANGRK